MSKNKINDLIWQIYNENNNTDRYFQIVSNETLKKGILLKPNNDEMKSLDLFIVRYGIMVTTVAFYVFISRDLKEMALVFDKFGNANIAQRNFKYCIMLNTKDAMGDLSYIFDIELSKMLYEFFDNTPFNEKGAHKEIYFVRNFPLGVVLENLYSFVPQNIRCYYEYPSTSFYVDDDDRETKKDFFTLKVYKSYNKECDTILVQHSDRIYIMPEQYLNTQLTKKHWYFSVLI